MATGAGSLTTAFTFLASYGLGCVVAMTMATVLIGKRMHVIGVEGKPVNYLN